MKYLYFREKSQCEPKEKGIDTFVFTPKIGRLYLPEETHSTKQSLVRILFSIISFGKARLVYVRKDNKMAHTSYVIPKCIKFPFMDKNDYEIGPCFTYPEFRGQGIYPEVLKTICNTIGGADTTFI